jgi:ATP-dependent Lon protease
MEVIELPGYTERDKVVIGRQFIVPKQLKEHGISKDQLEIQEPAITEVVRNYTREAGVRNLEREIGSICRKVARKLAVDRDQKIVVRQEDVREYLGAPRFRYDVAEKSDEVGIATGLAVTAFGGDVLFVEASLVPGHGGLTLTGSLGNVMQESARAAFTFARSRWAALGVPENFYEHVDIHIHVPAGAIPKDGPSAGVTMTTALVSAITQRPVCKDVCMTGEITLRGKVLPIGGVKQKVLAAHRAGLRTVILPKDNERDLEDVPAEVRQEMTFLFAENVDQVLNWALLPVRVPEKIDIVPVIDVAQESVLEGVASRAAKDPVGQT